MEHILHAVEQHVITLHRQEKNHKSRIEKTKASILGWQDYKHGKIQVIWKTNYQNYEVNLARSQGRASILKKQMNLYISTLVNS